MRNKKMLTIYVKWACVTLVMYVLGRVKVVYPNLSPFASAPIFALLSLSKLSAGTILSYVVGNSLASFSINGLYISLAVAMVACFTLFLQKKSKLKLNKYVMIVPLLISNISYVVLNAGGLKENLILIISLMLSLLFYFVCLNFMVGFFRRGNLMLNLDEKVCGGVALIVFSMGLAELNIPYVDILKIFALLCILISSYSFSAGTTMIMGVLFGVGESIVALNIVWVAVYVGYATVALSFKSSYRALSSAGVVCLDILYGVLFKVYNNYNIIMVLWVGLPALVFAIAPLKYIHLIKDKFAFSRDKVAVRSLVNRTKSGICKRMNELSQVFKEMDRVFRNMIKGTLSKEDSVEVLSEDLINKVCVNCPEKNRCIRANNTKRVFQELATAGLERGKATLLDVPQYLAGKCGRINFMLSTLNQSLKSYKNYTNMVTNMDASRVLIADQLGGVSDILKKLAEEIRLNISFDNEKENRIIEELSYGNIVCYEAIVYEESSESVVVSLLIKNEQVDKKKLGLLVSNACKIKMSVESIEPSSVPGANVVSLKNSPHYDLVFGVASVSKNGLLKNGDAHSMIKIDNGKYIMSLCDGIGSGEKAREISSLSISLIENFYRAGFENETILNSINRLLSLNNEENFSSVDLCIMDFQKNIFDFIKLGATYGFVKNVDGTFVVESSGLPIGVLEEMRPHITEKTIKDFDTVIMISDGISDAFGNKSDLQDYINSIESNNPQTIADQIMDRARDINNGVIKDDMTVLVARVFPV